MKTKIVPKFSASISLPSSVECVWADVTYRTQSMHIPLKMAATCSPKISEQFLFSFQDLVSRKTIFLL